MHPSRPRHTSPQKQAGFIVTLELILILSILGVGLTIGIVALRDALLKHYVNQQERDVYVFDAQGTVLGRAIGFDEHEAPLILYFDRSQSVAYRALVGVRDDRFTSREPIYYTQLNCRGEPCMKAPSSELADNRGIDSIPGTGSVSYLYALQGGPTYGVGRSSGGVPGNLYRQGIEACSVDLTNAALGSRYVSQKVVFGEPCESPFTLPLPIGEAPRICTGAANSLTCPQVGPDACGVNSGDCACPIGYYDAGAELGLLGQCCPVGTTAKPDSIGLGVLCEGGGLVKAESVLDPNDASRNVLESFKQPYQVNLPGNAGEPDSWTYIPPDSESGAEELRTISN